MTDKCAIIGKGESVLAFSAAGVDAFFAANAESARSLLRKAAQSYPVIFITDDLAAELSALIARMAESPYPVIVPVPVSGGKSEFARNKMKEEMDRALGVDILFQREDK